MPSLVLALCVHYFYVILLIKKNTMTVMGLAFVYLVQSALGSSK